MLAEVKIVERSRAQTAPTISFITHLLRQSRWTVCTWFHPIRSS